MDNVTEIKTKGVPIYELLEQLWVVPALVKGIELKIWENPGHYEHISAVWRSVGYLDAQGLTEAGEIVVKCKGLLEYECRLIDSQLNGDKAETVPANYEMLRDGLAAYCETHLWPALRDMDKMLGLPEDALILDMCGGSGSYLECLLKSHPDRRGVLVDKSPQPTDGLIATNQLSMTLEADFKKDGQWYQELFKPASFDVIMLNEIFHCVSKVEQHYLLTMARALLKPDGKIIVGEQNRNFRLEWRMETYTEFGKCLDMEDVCELAERSKLTADKMFGAPSHWFVILRKEA